MSRTSSSLKNLITALIGQSFGILISLFSRIIFLKYLNEQYLGLNGLFTNILTIFSLVELGIGPAMNFSLYKPLAEKNISLIQSLMTLYKKAYIIIGCGIAAIGFLFTPFYTFFLDSIPDIPRLTLIYWLFTLNTVISYFFSYKRALIICDEKRYIATMYRYGFYFAMNVVQILVLISTQNYILYLVIQILATLTENIAVSQKANKMYPYLKEKDIVPIPKDTTKDIKKNISAMLMHKVGGMVVNSTDNLVLSKFVGLVAVGVYSNYYLITDALNKIISQVFTSIMASVGNLNALHSEKNLKKLESIFEKVFFLNFWIYGFCSCCLWGLFNPFISIWLGDGLLLSPFTVFIIVLNFYITGMRKTVLTFHEATGTFYYDRWKPLVESIVNIVASIILTKHIGIAGVFLGTIISTLSTSIWIETHVLHKYIFKKSCRKYGFSFVRYTIISFIACIVTTKVGNMITIPNEYINFICRFCICMVVPNIIFFILFFKTENFKFFFSLISSLLMKKNKHTS